MDFAKLDLREAAGHEYWVHLRVGDTLLYADEAEKKRPCRVKVASANDDGVEKALKVMERAGRKSQSLEERLIAANREQRKELERQADDAEQASRKSVTAFLRLAIRDWENIEVKGEEVAFSQETLRDLTEYEAPFFRLSVSISKDMAALYNPFSRAESA